MQTNVDYWQDVYASSAVPTFPSQFSVFVQSWLCSTNANIVEVGCGNGRDARFFHGLGHQVTVSDQVICEELRSYAQSRHGFAAVESSIDSVVAALSGSINLREPVVLYSRFFQHAISETDQRIMLQSLGNALHKDSLLFFEFRLDADEDGHKEFGTTHFRRFQSAEEFKSTLNQCGFECVYDCEGTGYARYKSEDPVVGRFVAKPGKRGHLRLVSESTPATPPVESGLSVQEENQWISGISTDCKEGLVEIKLNDDVLTRVHIQYNEAKDCGTFVFRPSPDLISAIPAEYTLSALLPNGDMLTHPDPTPLGGGDGSLQEKLDAGYMVSAKAGYLFKPPAANSVWREDIFKAYNFTRDALASIGGVSDVFVAYGSLLGQVREGDFIAHDDDFDAAVIVDAENPVQAAQEFHRIVDALRNRGYKVHGDTHLGNFHIYPDGLPDVDVFLMYYRESVGELCSYNLATKCSKELVLPLQTAQLAGHDVLVPNNSEGLLAAIYGANWATPDPYFQWNMTPHHDNLKHAFAAASKAIAAGESIPDYQGD
jgi:hypothetical protein